MILFTEKINDSKYFIRSIVYDTSTLNEQTKDNGIEIENIPEPTPTDKQTYNAYYNPITKEIFYEYIDMQD